MLRLAEHIDKRGDLALEGADALVGAALGARRQAKELGCDEILAFATSAVRDAGNSAEVLERVSVEAGIDLIVLSGDEEARLTFLAVRRWFGWSAGRLICLDIGGGSLELAAGSDEAPDIADLAAARRRPADPRLARGRPAEQGARSPRCASTSRPRSRRPRTSCAATARPDRVIATSKTFRTLARLAGAAPSSAGPARHSHADPHRAAAGDRRSSPG